jgi:hypothetical protein
MQSAAENPTVTPSQPERPERQPMSLWERHNLFRDFEGETELQELRSSIDPSIYPGRCCGSLPFFPSAKQQCLFDTSSAGT